MSNTLGSALLWLFVINLGIACGAVLYEHRIVVFRWVDRSAAPIVRWDAHAALHDDAGRRFWAFVTTVPLTLLTIANLLAAGARPARFVDGGSRRRLPPLRTGRSR